MTDAKSAHATEYRKRWRWSRRAVVILVMTSVSASWVTVKMPEWSAAHAICRSGGWVRYDVLGNVYKASIDTDVGLANSHRLRHLQVLFLNSEQVTDAGLEHLEGITELRALTLSHTAASDVGLGHIEGLGQLRYLQIWESRITDASLKHAASLHHLEFLEVWNSPITDVGLDSLAGLTQLRRASFVGTKVTEDGMEKLRQALPDCKIFWKPPAEDERQSPAKAEQPDG